jgi:hypothetical protein
MEFQRFLAEHSERVSKSAFYRELRVFCRVLRLIARFQKRPDRASGYDDTFKPDHSSLVRTLLTGFVAPRQLCVASG